MFPLSVGIYDITIAPVPEVAKTSSLDRCYEVTNKYSGIIEMRTAQLATAVKFAFESDALVTQVKSALSPLASGRWTVSKSLQ